MSKDWPREVQARNAGRLLHVAFESGFETDIPAELLRVESPSAEVKGHGPGQEQLVWGKRDVAITRMEAVGNYAVRLIFSDGHSTGIFTWDYLQQLGGNQHDMMHNYVTRLTAAGLSR